MTTTRNPADVITIVRDFTNVIGKQFTRETDGTVTKKAVVAVSLGRAEMRYVPDQAALQALLTEVGDDAHAAVINAGFRGVEFNEPFLLMSERALASNKRDTNRQALVGVHERVLTSAVAGFSVGDKVKAMGRFKENVYASTWQILDRDPDEHTPQQYRDLTHENWLQEVDKLLPGLCRSGRTTTVSSSARVFHNGVALGNGHGHTWIQVNDANDVERVRAALLIRAAKHQMTWLKPKFSKASGAVCGHALTTIVDQSTWTPGRFIFCGRPVVVGEGITVRPQAFQIYTGGRLDTTAAALPDQETIRRVTRAAGCELRLRSSGNRLVFDDYGLRFGTELETEIHGLLTVEEALNVGVDKIRCQAPFRASTSFAAYLGRAKDGRPFVHDVGTGTNHWLCNEDALQGDFGIVETTAAEVIADLRRLNLEEVVRTWATKAAAVSPVDAEKVIEEVKRLTGIAIRPLRIALKEARRDVDRANRERRLREDAGEREQLAFDPTRKVELALQIEKLIIARYEPRRYCVFGGLPAEIIERELPYTHAIDDSDAKPPNVPSIAVLDRVAMLARVENVAQLQVVTNGSSQAIAVPQDIIEALLNKRDHAAPSVMGLVTHPVVLLNGSIVSADGLHNDSRLIVVGGAVNGCRPYSKGEAAEAIVRLMEHFLEGFEFESPLDKVAALALLLTAVQRKLLDIAPGMLVEATTQSTGKTTMLRRLHLILTRRDLPVMAFPGNEEEMQKAVLSLLLASPAMVVLDNLADGLTLRSATLAMLLTAPTFKKRILGISRDAEVPTNTLVAATGNNLRLGLDENTRWLRIRLEARTARPEQRRFAHADVVAHALGTRDQVLRDAVGIVAGYLVAGGRMDSATRFPAWDRVVRQPLLWAGAGDVAEVFTRNSEESEEIGAHGALIRLLQQLFRETRFKAGDVVRKAVSTVSDFGRGDTTEEQMCEVLTSLRVKDVNNTNSIGWLLNRLHGRRCAVDGAEVWLEADKDSGGRKTYRIRSDG